MNGDAVVIPPVDLPRDWTPPSASLDFEGACPAECCVPPLTRCEAAVVDQECFLDSSGVCGLHLAPFR